MVNQTEAIECIKGGADILDVKNPKEGALGANFPHVIREIKQVTPKNLELSATIGDMPNLPGTASLAALGTAASGVDYVKVGLLGAKTAQEATTLMIEVVRAVKDYNQNIKTIASGYADYKTVGCISPLELPEVAYNSKADGVLVDVKTKNKTSNLFTFLDDSQLKQFVESAHNYNLLAALAGSLCTKDIQRVNLTGADIIGVRGAVCENKDRVSGRLESQKVAELVSELNKL